MFTRFDTIHVCDSHPATAPQQTQRLCVASRGKNYACTAGDVSVAAAAVRGAHRDYTCLRNPCYLLTFYVRLKIQEAQLSLRGRARAPVIKYFANSLNVTQDH